ncbi:DUF2255 family protein [Agromyces lapidis]|uniref:DUF2255 family protein n=1 Tax=Agromyces lapidis TaxID=279574 RepID=A0ABV5SSE0_9MICO|nr:DUF2255 family protein [Agromyces lapidis]
MTAWNTDELERIGAAEELKLASYRPDGTLRPYVVMWVARVGDELYTRSAYGPDAGWYRRALASGRGRILAGGVEREVRFEPGAPEANAPLDAEYHRKYDRYGEKIVGTVVGEHRYGVTVRLAPFEA